MRSLVAGAAGIYLAFAQVAPSAKIEAPAPRIQLAILLDTSNSMDGLIDQARGELWRVVNSLSKVKRGDKTARLEVALYEYGNSRLSVDRGYVRRVVPFTIDLDRVSEELFALSTNGGDEWPGRALKDADRELDWSGEDADLKVAFVAGNEPFDQGPVAFRESIGALRKRGVHVSTVFCGGRDDSDTGRWREAASLGAGAFMCIDTSKRVAYRAAPQDEELARLGVELNQTYVYYGAEGQASYQRQAAQDANAMRMGHGSFLNRAAVKASASYSNSGWDLVDAHRDGKAQASRLADDQLPEALRALKAAERDAYVAKMAARRAELNRRIAALNAERELFLNSQSCSATGHLKTFDSALLDALKGLAVKRGWTWQGV